MGVDKGQHAPPRRARQAAGAAALDVFEAEPLPRDHPLRTAPRTVLTPHLGYVTDRGYRLFYGDAVDDIAAWDDPAFRFVRDHIRARNP